MFTSSLLPLLFGFSASCNHENPNHFPQRTFPTPISHLLNIFLQVWSDLQTDLLPSFLFNSATQRFVPAPGHIRTLRPPMPHGPPHFLAGCPVENAAAAQLADLSAQFVGGVHIDAVVEALGKQGLPWLVHQASLHLEHLVSSQSVRKSVVS